ncbi:MAG: hypothetical protein IT243_09005 [Bacteroidia bacterium]|nr:hypothetical protein [Bacteroidia bacterium]
MKNFYLILISITAVLSMIFFILENQSITKIGNVGWIALLYYVLLTILFTNIALKTRNKSNSRFVTTIMGLTGLRLFLCIIFIIIYRFVQGKTDLNFIFYFFILYLFYTVFEIKNLLYKLRADIENDNRN